MTPAWESAREAAGSMPSVDDFAPDATSPSAAEDPFADWDEQLRDVQEERDASGGEEPAEKVGLYDDARAPMSEDVVPAAATGQPAIDAMPPELIQAYPSLQDTAAYETFGASRGTPEAAAIYAGEPAEAWEAAAAGESDHGARERTARILERIASRVRSGELHAPELPDAAGDAAVLAALLASMLGGPRERGA